MTRSAGLLMYRPRDGRLEVLLVHPGGPFFARRDDGWWSIPKGLVEEGEASEAAAVREFNEETGLGVAPRELIDLGEVTLKSGKRVRAWAFAGDADPAAVKSDTFELEWPPKSGRRQAFPEVDRAAWFDLDTARRKLNAAQTALLDRLAAALTQERA